jgi:hypothetical protein
MDFMSSKEKGSSTKTEQQNFTKTNISFLAKKKIEEVENPLELISRAKIMSLMADDMRKSAVEVLLADESFESETWQGITVTKRAGASKKVYYDSELEKLEELLSKTKADIKARKAYLDDLGEYTKLPGNETIAVLLPK